MVNLVLAFILAAYRLAGHKQPAFQAVSHLFVGGLFGAFIGSYRSHKRWDWIAIAVILSLIELYQFLHDHGKL